MGVAVDTVLGQVTNSVALTGVTVAQGDTLGVRAFPQSGRAFVEAIIFKGGQVTNLRLTSPSFHDNVRGINLISAQAPTQYNLPQEFGQPLVATDVLSLQLNSGAANSSVAGIVNYYSDLNGASARLASLGDVQPLFKSIKVIEVDCTSSGTIGQWSDTLITATEGNLLHAGADYAVLGYQVDTPCALVGIKGTDTANYRVCGPGTTLEDTTTDYFVEMAMRHGVPHIPVINAQNAGATFVSVADNAASTAVKVQVICAELSQVIPRAS
jgi:hypothetical protein